MDDQYKPQSGTWTLTAPDGRQWQAASGLMAAAKEQNERIPPEVMVDRIMEAAEPDEIDRLRDAIALAYGYLWHVNNEPGTPCRYPPEKAAYEARKVLRDLMTHEQRGEAINKAREILMGHNAELRGRPLADGPA